jgi:arsenate reductase
VEVQIFGTQKSQDTRKALRFFSERRVKVHFVDLKERAASKGELTRFAQKFGITALIDTDSNRYRDLGLGATRYGDDRWMQQLCDEPLILRQPLTRWGSKLTIGLGKAEWQRWIDEDKTK